jgi:hypothetical protein
MKFLYEVMYTTTCQITVIYNLELTNSMPYHDQSHAQPLLNSWWTSIMWYIFTSQSTLIQVKQINVVSQNCVHHLKPPFESSMELKCFDLQIALDIV